MTRVFDVKVWSRPKKNFKHCIRLPPTCTGHGRVYVHTRTHQTHTHVSPQQATRPFSENEQRQKRDRKRFIICPVVKFSLVRVAS